MTLDDAIKLLPKIEEAATLTSERWSRTYNAELSRSEIGARLEGDKIFPILAILPSCTSADRELAEHAPQLMRAALIIIQEGKRQRLALKQQIADLQQAAPSAPSAPETREPAPKRRMDNAALCAVKSKEQPFQRFLMDRKGLVDASDQERIDVFVRELLQVQSRSELDEDPAALARFRDLLAEFEAWRRV